MCSSSAVLKMVEMYGIVGKMAIKFYCQLKPQSYGNASRLGVPPKQYLQVLGYNKLGEKLQ